MPAERFTVETFGPVKPLIVVLSLGSVYFTTESTVGAFDTFEMSTQIELYLTANVTRTAVTFRGQPSGTFSE